MTCGSGEGLGGVDNASVSGLDFVILFGGEESQGFLELPDSNPLLLPLLTNALGTRGCFLGSGIKSPVVRLESRLWQWSRERVNANRADIWVRSNPWKLPECKTLAQVPWRERTSQLQGWAAVTLILVPESTSRQRT